MMWMILQADKPDDYVISTGKSHSVRDFIIKSFEYVGIEIEFKNEGINEIGIVSKCNNPKYNLDKNSIIIKVDSKYFRPTEVDLLIGDSSKARKKFNWMPKYSFEMLVEEMMENDLKIIQ